MNFDRFIAVVACVATVICTIIAVLSYLYKQKRKKMTAQSDPLQRSCVLLGQKKLVEMTKCSGTSLLLIYHQLAFSSNQHCIISKKRTFLHTSIQNKRYILYCFLEVPDSLAASPEFNWFCQNLILGRLCGMTLYEILSLAIDLAILILAALSYLKDRKS